MEQGHDLAPVSAMTCEEVVSIEGDTIGFIKDFMVDMDDGVVAYVVLAFGGLFGIGTRRVAVPWRLLERKGRRYLLHLDKNILHQIPGVDEDGTVRALDSVWARHLGGGT